MLIFKTKTGISYTLENFLEHSFTLFLQKYNKYFWKIGKNTKWKLIRNCFVQSNHRISEFHLHQFLQNFSTLQFTTLGELD